MSEPNERDKSVKDARRALSCLFIAVEPDVAESVRYHVEKAFTEIEAKAKCDRDFEWWQELCLADAVAHEPQEVKRWVLQMAEEATREGAREVALLAREYLQATGYDHAEGSESDIWESGNLLWTAIRALLPPDEPQGGQGE